MRAAATLPGSNPSTAKAVAPAAAWGWVWAAEWEWGEAWAAALAPEVAANTSRSRKLSQPKTRRPVRQQTPVMAEILDQISPPGFAVAIGRLGCDVAQQVGMRHESRHVPLKTPAQRRIWDNRHRAA